MPALTSTQREAQYVHVMNGLLLRDDSNSPLAKALERYFGTGNTYHDVDNILGLIESDIDTLTYEADIQDPNNPSKQIKDERPFQEEIRASCLSWHRLIYG